MNIPNLAKKQASLAKLVDDRLTKIAGDKFVLTRVELKKNLGNMYLEVIENTPWIYCHKNEGWTSSSEVWKKNGRSVAMKDGAETSWKGRAKLFSVIDHQAFQAALGYVPQTFKPKTAKQKSEMKKAEATKRKANERSLKSLDVLEQQLVSELRAAWKNSGRLLKDFHFKVQDGRIYSSVHSMKSSEREEFFVNKLGYSAWDVRSHNPFQLALMYQKETGDTLALETIREGSFYEYLFSNLLLSSLSQNDVTTDTFPRKTQGIQQNKSVTQLLENGMDNPRATGKKIMNLLLNAKQAIPGTKKAFDMMNLSSFFKFIQKQKRKARKLQQLDGKAGLGLLCQEAEEKIIRKTIGKGLLEKGFRFIDLHDGFYTNAPDSEVEALISQAPGFLPEDFTRTNTKLPEAPKQIEAVLTPPKEMRASQSLLLPPNPFQALDDFMNEIGLELNHIPEHDILEQEVQTCRR